MPDTAAAARAARELIDMFGPGLITAQQAHRVISDRALRTAVARGTAIRLHRGVYAVARDRSDRSDYCLRVAAAIAVRPGATASHESALALHGLSLPTFGGNWRDLPVRLIAPHGERVSSASLRVSRRSLPDAHRSTTSWGPATSPARTAVDLARELPFAAGLLVADEACALALLAQHRPAIDFIAARDWPGYRTVVANRWSDAQELLRLVESEAPWQSGRSRVRRVAQWVDPAAESPGESVSRAHLVAAGLPRPQLGLRVAGDDGQVFYADLAWAEHGVLGEVDGFGKYRDDAWDTFRREKRREDALRAAGWTVIRWTVSDVLRNPAWVVKRVKRALSAAQPSGRPSLPGAGAPWKRPKP